MISRKFHKLNVLSFIYIELTKRKENVQTIISNLKLETEVIDAVDGNKLTLDEISNYLSKKNLYKPNYPFKINNGEIGCFLSHRAVWKKIVEEKLDFGSNIRR